MNAVHTLLKYYIRELPEAEFFREKDGGSATSAASGDCMEADPIDEAQLDASYYEEYYNSDPSLTTKAVSGTKQTSAKPPHAQQ